MKKKTQIIVWSITVIIVATIIFVVGLLSHISSGIWVGDYKITFVNNLSAVSICDYRGDESIEIPTHIGPFKVYNISNDIFEENEIITSVYLPSDPDFEGTLDINNCPNLTKVEYADGTTDMYVSVFHCNNLRELVIPEGIEEISGCALWCSSLDIKFPSSLKRGDKNLFEGSKLYEMHKNDKYYMVGDGVLFYFGAYDEDIVIPKGTKSFCDAIYCNKIDQRNIYIPENVNILGIQVYNYDTVFFGNGEIKNLDLNYLNDGVTGTIVAPANSYMDQYCKENGYNFRIMTDEEEKTWRELTEAAASEIIYQE